MGWGRYRTAAATADAWLVEPIRGSDHFQTLGRFVVWAGIVAVFTYSSSVAWTVLDSLRRVSVADATAALRFVSVRDAILCAVAWRVGRALLQTLPRRRD
jgi:hypothetical protein